MYEVYWRGALQIKLGSPEDVAKYLYNQTEPFKDFIVVQETRGDLWLLGNGI